MHKVVVVIFHNILYCFVPATLEKSSPMILFLLMLEPLLSSMFASNRHIFVTECDTMLQSTFIFETCTIVSSLLANSKMQPKGQFPCFESAVIIKTISPKTSTTTLDLIFCHCLPLFLTCGTSSCSCVHCFLTS